MRMKIASVELSKDMVCYGRIPTVQQRLEAVGLKQNATPSPSRGSDTRKVDEMCFI